MYSIGLSLALLVLVGLFMNISYPFLGIEKPLSLNSLLMTFTMFILVLSLLTYARDSRSPHTNTDNSQLVFWPSTLLLLLMPFVSIFGTFLMNVYSENSVQLLLLLCIAIVTILVGFGKLSQKIYPLAVFVISISLLFHRTLISNYIHGWDIQWSYYVSELVRTNKIWDQSIGGQNILLVLSMVSTIYSTFCGLNLHWTYKAFYSFFFSLVPLGLFHIYKNFFEDQLSDKEAIFSVMIFMFYPRFFWCIPGKQRIAELFLVILLMLSIDKKIKLVVKSFLAIIFSFAIIQSHYGISYILILSFVFVYLLSIYTNNSRMKSILSSNYIALFIIMTISWYFYTGSGDIFYQLTHITKHILESISEIFTKIRPRTGLYVLFSNKYVLLSYIHDFLFLFLSLLIAVGVLKSIIHLIKKRESRNDLIALSIPFFLFLVISFFIAGGLGADRAYQISLILLSPFSITGYKSVLHMSKEKTSKFFMPSIDLFFSVFLVLFLLFNSGFIYYVSGFTLSSNFAIDKNSDYPYFNDQEMQAAEWIVTHHKNGSEIYADSFAKLLFIEYFGPESNPTRVFWAETEKITENSYLYFRNMNIRGKIMSSIEDYMSLENSKVSKVINNMNKVYDNGGGEVRKKSK